MRILSVLALALLFLAPAGFVLADGTQSPAIRPMAGRPHPRIHEIHWRMRNQMLRIREGVKSGKLTKAQAQALHQQLKQIQEEMQADFKANGKRELTEDQLKQLNQQLNEISKSIYDEKNPEPAPPTQ